MLNLQHRKEENVHNCRDRCDDVKNTVKLHAKFTAPKSRKSELWDVMLKILLNYMLKLLHRKVENLHNCRDRCDHVKSAVKLHAKFTAPKSRKNA